ncbi:hypothetical protein GO684_04905 [Wolbachia endosymbiont of Litomosoides brasiliensis]|uniref:hypothetical protein n=1 Tax=Wolbachia endosymbiont of Litomosoides brasiliensis TaxID=1812117 RepID=UPI001588DBF5|nr:hypothetical protein [Wolbachia endosymbiont of Litomosoides brasiliensis]NUY39931.1 hypothetical protein [Wolbachia endosymbiont of Litomosoides brasiliensis]
MSESVVTKILIPQAKDQEPLKPSTQEVNKDEKIFKKEKHQLIYRAFLDTLGNLEKQTQREINKIQEKLQGEISEREVQKLRCEQQSLEELLNRLKNEDEKKIFTFVFKNSGRVFNDVSSKIKPLSEEDLFRFLLSVFKEIREKKLASEENLKNGKIGKVVAECVSKEAWHQFANFAKYQIPGRGLLEKIPGLEKVLSVEKKEDEPPLSDEEIVTTFLRKSLLPVIALTATILFVGSTLLFSIPHFVTMGLAVFCFATAEYNAIKSLFSNNKSGTLYSPHPQEEEKKERWNEKFLDGINKILESQGKEAEKSEQSAVTTEKQSAQEKVKDNTPFTKLEGTTTNQQSRDQSPQSVNATSL